MNKSVTRSTVNEEQYAAPEFSKSGFALPYSRHTSFMLGRIHASGVHYVMPGDKIYGQNNGDLTYNEMSTPMVSPSDAGQYNFYVTLRSLDKTFEQGMTPTELNAMSADWHTPKCNTRDLARKVFLHVACNGDENSDGFAFLQDVVVALAQNPNITLAAFLNSTSPSAYSLYGVGVSSFNIVSTPVANLTTSTSTIYQMAEKMYLADALQDIADNITAKLGSAENPISTSQKLSDFFYTYLDVIFTPWIGRYSYYGELRYNYLRPFDYYRISRLVGTPTGNPDIFSWLDDTPLCEYSLRGIYAIWYERFRDVHIEPVSKDLPYWRDFGSTSIFDLDAGGNLCYLLYRIRPWYNDPYTSAQVDNISRHVYAPIVNGTAQAVAYRGDNENNLDTQDVNESTPRYPSSLRKPVVYNLGWRDQLEGVTKTISCPVPANINDVLAQADRDFTSVYGLDLNTLRQSQMLERYLKRNYLFGDEYQDRMLAHYNSRVSDMRINKPELLGQSLNQSQMKQEVANVSTSEMQAGHRTATSTVQFGGDDYGTFCEEFGIVFNILTIMPHAIYDGLDAHLLLDQQQDFPLPEFAANNEEFMRKCEIASSGLAADLLGDSENRNFMFGRVPAYHIWRGRADEVGGMFLDELQDCTFRRFWGMFSTATTPKQNYWFLHCRPNLGMFVNTNRYDSQVYGTVEHQFMCERVLPTPVEVI